MIYLYAFLIGGLICMAGQLLMDLTKLTPARILVLFVCLGVVLGGLGWYPKLVELAGAGATVPLTGFGNALAQRGQGSGAKGRSTGRVHRRVYRLRRWGDRGGAQRTGGSLGGKT